MTQIAIQEQINATKKVTAEALKSKEYAEKILTNIGIVKKQTSLEIKDKKKK